jgi:hypothetical protein
MGILAAAADERIQSVDIDEDFLTVGLMDGRRISVPLAWYPRLLNAAPELRRKWQISAAGYGLHWPDIDEDLSTEGLLRGAPAPRLLELKSDNGASASTRRKGRLTPLAHRRLSERMKKSRAERRKTK